MIPLIVVVEGETERAFVDDVLERHLRDYNLAVTATVVGKGGGGPWSSWRKDLQRILGGDKRPQLRVTTMFDLYGLPKGFPGLSEHRDVSDTVRRCELLEASLAKVFKDRRFIPYLQRHEFEALVLASLPALREWFDDPTQLEGIDAVEAQTTSTPPEDINDGKTTAPSKRLESAIRGYRKALHGPDAVKETGLPTVREACPRFHAWLTTLERLGATKETLDE